MAFISGFVNDSTELAHISMVHKIRDFAVLNGYTILREVSNEIILKAPGYTGADPCFVGFYWYESSTIDVYNIAVATFTGYVPGNTFAGQPGAVIMATPAHNRRIDFWLCVSPQRIACVLKVGTPVYESFYVGKMNPYARPSQYPYPVVCCAMLNGTPLTRFSETTHTMGFKGAITNIALWTNAGKITPLCYPFSIANTVFSNLMRDTNGVYPIIPIELTDAANMYGALEGVFHITGFDNVVENITTIDGVDYLVVQDVWRTGFGNYFALRLD